MKIKTSELKGGALDFATAVADGFDADYLKRNPNAIPEYSEYWNDCGDLITEHEINLSNEDGEWFASMAPHMNECIQSGETPQIAICRAVVINFLGDEVDIPDDLVGEDDKS